MAKAVQFPESVLFLNWLLVTKVAPVWLAVKLQSIQPFGRIGSKSQSCTILRVVVSRLPLPKPSAKLKTQIPPHCDFSQNQNSLESNWLELHRAHTELTMSLYLYISSMNWNIASFYQNPFVSTFQITFMSLIQFWMLQLMHLRQFANFYLQSQKEWKTLYWRGFIVGWCQKTIFTLNFSSHQEEISAFVLRLFCFKEEEFNDGWTGLAELLAHVELTGASWINISSR